MEVTFSPLKRSLFKKTPPKKSHTTGRKQLSTLVFQSYLLRFFGVWMVCFWGPVQSHLLTVSRCLEASKKHQTLRSGTLMMRNSSIRPWPIPFQARFVAGKVFHRSSNRLGFSTGKVSGGCRKVCGFFFKGFFFGTS